MDGKRINNAPNVFDDCKQNKSLCIRCCSMFHVSMQTIFFSRWNFFSIVSVCRVGRQYVSLWPLLVSTSSSSIWLSARNWQRPSRCANTTERTKETRRKGRETWREEAKRSKTRSTAMLRLLLPCGIKVKIVKENTNTADGNGRIFYIK